MVYKQSVHILIHLSLNFFSLYTGELILHDLVHVVNADVRIPQDWVCYCGGVAVFIILLIIDCIDLLMGVVGLVGC